MELGSLPVHSVAASGIPFRGGQPCPTVKQPPANEGQGPQRWYMPPSMPLKGEQDCNVSVASFQTAQSQPQDKLPNMFEHICN